MTSLMALAENASGSISILTAASLAASISLAALAVDLGMLYQERRHAQGAVDLAAIAAANDLERAEAAARATLLANGIVSFEDLRVERGRYEPDRSLATTRRFVPDAMPTNAVRLHLRKPGATYFARVFATGSWPMEVEATAATASLATFSVGSRLLAVRGGVANALLGAMLGTRLDLSVMDYEALAAADIQLVPLLDRLATDLDLEAGSYDEVLSQSVRAGDLLSVASAIVGDGGDRATARILSAGAGADASVPLGGMLDLGPLGGLSLGDPDAAGLGASVSALDLLRGTAALATGGHQVEADLSAGLPGFLSLTAEVAIGEPMQHSSWVGVGQSGSQLHTAQTRLKLTARIGGAGLPGGAAVRIPIYLELASAEARLASVECAYDRDPTATIAVLPSAANLWLGDLRGGLDDWGTRPEITPARIVTMPLVHINGRAHVEIGSLEEEPLTFDQGDVDDGTVKRASSRDLGASLVGSLLGRLELQASAAGFGIAVPSGLTTIVARELQTAAEPLDLALQSVLETLGVHVGEADVVVRGIACRTGVLTG